MGGAGRCRWRSGNTPHAGAVFRKRAQLLVALQLRRLRMTSWAETQVAQARGAEMTDDTPTDQLLQLINGYQVSQAIHVASVLKIANLLRDGPRTVDDLAADADVQVDSLYRLLRALAAVGVFREELNRSFALTPLAEGL